MQMQMHSPCQGEALGITAFANQILHLIAMAHMHRRLLNDRAIVEVLCHVVGRGTNQLHTPLPGSVIRLRTLKSGKEGMVDIDHRGKTTEEIRTQHLHVFSQHGELNAVALQQLEHARLRFGLGGRSHGHASKRHSEFLTERFKIRVIGHHQSNLHR